MTKNIFEIVLTGGPCGGKSTIVEATKSMLEKRGFKVIIVAEAATEVLQSGVKPWEIGEFNFQTIITDKILVNERCAIRAARRYVAQGQKVVILYDRGLCDNKAYCSAEDWRQIMSDFGLTDEIMNTRYDAVLNIVTTAYGAEDIWDLQRENNTQRYEKTAEQARTKEDATQKAWAGHHNFQVFGNGPGGWPEKERRVLDAVLKTVGLSKKKRYEKTIALSETYSI